MTAQTIYTASELKDRRTEILEEALHGRALVRAVDGTALVLTPLTAVERSETVAHWAMVLLTSRDRPAAAELSWLRHLDNDDRQEFLDEATAALADVSSGGPIAEFEKVISEWRTTALALADKTRRKVLLGDVTENDFEPVERPGGAA